MPMNNHTTDSPVTRKEKAVVFWSGGKDSAMALRKAQMDAGLEIVGLVTTVNSDTRKTSVHEISERALESQAKLTGLPLRKMTVEENPDNSEYERQLLNIYRGLKDEGIGTVVYGDIFLSDIKTYREGLLEKAGLKGLFPLWEIDTGKLMEDFIHSGFKAIICYVNTAFIAEAYLGRELGAAFLKNLPQNVDPAGENGEFHTFCFEGPVFKSPVPFTTGRRYTSTPTLKSAEQTTIYKVEHIEIL
jgi:uncharacterized protein (TIGR00290 family)